MRNSKQKQDNQQVHQYRQLNQTNRTTLYTLTLKIKGRGGGGGHHSYMTVPVSCLYDGIFLKSSKKKRRHQLKAAETDATKPFRSPIYCCIFSQRCHSLSLSLISPLVRASIFSDLCVNFFYGCLFHSLSLSSACPGCFTEWY